MVRLSHEQYRSFSEFLEQSSGIALGDNRQYLVASRLNPHVASFGFASLSELIDELRSARNPQLRAQVIEAMTTNETQFFRDGYPFELLKKHLFPECQRLRSGRLRLWSAGCSSGQEAYSTLITAQEYNSEGGLIDLEVLGTDISKSVVQQAAAGRFNAASVKRGLSPERLQRFFLLTDQDTWEIRPELRRRATFRQHNLKESFALFGRFDVIFCRNVLIYFSQATRADILTRMAAALNPGGYLLLGGSESIGQQVDSFELVRTAHGMIYQLRS